MKDPRKPLKLIEEWEKEGVPCRYARFQNAVPPKSGKDAEPVYEFTLDTTVLIGNKYAVESITYSPHGLIWRKGGEINIQPLTNVHYCRPL